MANNEQLKRLTDSVASWNEWREDNSGRIDLTWVDLSEADLSKADLSRVDLIGADLSGVDLSRADLKWANLRGADLSGADLSWANLRQADLENADLSNATLSFVHLFNANLRMANLEKTCMHCVKYKAEIWSFGNSAAEADLKEISAAEKLFRADLLAEIQQRKQLNREMAYFERKRLREGKREKVLTETMLLTIFLVFGGMLLLLIHPIGVIMLSVGGTMLVVMGMLASTK